MYARGNFPDLRSAARDGTATQDSACLSSGLHCRQPRRGQGARRRRHPQAGQRQCRRHQRTAYPGAGIRDLGHPHRHRQGLGRSRRVARASRCPRFRRRQQPRRCGCRRCAPSPPSSATSFRYGTAFAAARAWPRSSARSPASSSRYCCRCLPAWLGVVTTSGFVGLASIIAACAIPVYLLMRDGAVLSPVMGFALACALLVIYTHRGNVRRMRAGTEPRARRLWLFGRGRT